MSELMAGQVDAYQQGYDKGFQEGMRVGYERGIQVGNELLEKHFNIMAEERKFILNRDTE